MEDVSLKQILDAREARAQRQHTLLTRFGGALIVLTVNAPGPVKRLAAADRAFYAGGAALLRALTELPPLYAKTLDLPTGLEGYWAVDAAPQTLKRICCTLEETLPYGRALDFDVFGADGVPLSRTALGFAQRGCMVCGRSGAYCASRRLHPLPEILAAFERIAGTEEGV